MDAASTSTVTQSPSTLKQYYNTTNPFEKKFGYHRAVRKGPFISVSGTTAINPNDGKLHYAGNAGKQAIAAFREGVTAVQSLGGTVGDVIRVRMFVARQEDTGAVGEAFSKMFNGASPGVDPEAGAAATMIVVGQGGFVDPEMLVEIELDAIAS